METFVQATANDLRSLVQDSENNAPNDYLQFRLCRVIEDLVQFSADMDVEVEVAVLESLQEILCQLHILSETEEVTIGRPSYLLPPDIIEDHLLFGHTAGEIAQLFGVCERTIRRRMTQYGIWSF